jgi:hypothetical protein
MKEKFAATVFYGALGIVMVTWLSFLTYKGWTTLIGF